MSIATLDDIILKVRKLTGSGTDATLTDSQIIDYINSFYLYDFPAHYRSLKLKDIYTFNTIRGIDVYPFDSEHYTTVEAPAFCKDRNILLSFNPGNFYGLSTNWQQQNSLSTGDGTTGPYSGTISPYPIIRSVNNNPIVTTNTSPTGVYPAGRPLSFFQAIPGRVQNLLITVNNAFGTTLNVTDDGAGTLIGDCSAGTVDYGTGAVAGLLFTSNVTSGASIVVQSKPANVNFPLYILFYQDQFTLRPVPDRGYTIQLTAYRQPSQALLGTDDPDDPNYSGTPELRENWEVLAFGASKKIYQDRLDSDGIQLMNSMLEDAYAIAEVRTYAQIGSAQRINTIYAGQTDGYGSGYGVIFNNNSGQ
jgi:hypothetical protein